ncbi:MBL fold hydrolase [Siphonobacter sp. BAB-5385]|uniref:MBL fold metallo-hydrolase n=1 Tax=unclassified Siphonobacter TaxID=2635712 RepID=UPI000B9E6FA9|nr:MULTISPECIES: MBL fold metallo-hydrolase [unclassified Siphonobacter]OZI08271.1 MBL fold hydrolase [Siphonobacter sp. BAB-5385]PMD97370.1 MBL fold hydrolase [Siphonobacter sp. BAB-5405]
MLYLQVFTFNGFQENTYVLWDDTKEAVIIDPGCSDRQEREELTEFISDEGLKVVKLLNTHAHVDHVLGNAFVKRTYGVPYYLHPLDVPVLKSVAVRAPSYRIFDYEEAEPDAWLEEGVPVTFGDTTLEVLHVPGHAPGHVAFINRESNLCISGDVLFHGSIGRWDFPGCNFDDLISSIKHKLFTLDDEMEVFPGHGPATTIGRERLENPYVGQNGQYA